MDIAKFLFAFAVLTVHNCNYALSDNMLWFYFEHLIFRMSVPFFFLTSGFLFGIKVKANEDKKVEYIKKNVRNLLRHYLFWGVTYSIVTIGFNLKHGMTIKGVVFIAIRDFLTFNPILMWYIGALIFSFLVIGLIHHKKTFQISLIIGAFLYCVGMLMGSYSGLFTGTIVEDALQIYYKLFVNSSNGIFVGYIFVGLGYYIGRYVEKTISKKKLILQILIGYIVISTEIMIVNNIPKCLEGNYDYLLGSLIISPALFLLILQCNVPDKISTDFFRKASSCIYFSHMLVISGVNLLFDLPLTVQYLLVIMIVTIGSVIIYKWNNKYINMIT